jgi:hypothetical protein
MRGRRNGGRRERNKKSGQECAITAEAMDSQNRNTLLLHYLTCSARFHLRYVVAYLTSILLVGARDSVLVVVKI